MEQTALEQAAAWLLEEAKRIEELRQINAQLHDDIKRERARRVLLLEALEDLLERYGQ